MRCVATFWREVRVSLVFLMLAAGAHGAGQPDQLVPNGNFEAGSTTGWKVNNPDKQPLEWGVTNDPSKVHSGKWAGALTKFGGKTSLLEISNGADVSKLKPGTLVKFRFFIKTDNVVCHYKDEWLKSSFMPVLYTFDAQGKELKRDHGLGYFIGTHNYMPIDVVMNVPVGAARLEIRFELDSALESGQVYLDDFTCEVIKNPGPLHKDITKAEVKRDANGIPRLFINDKATAPTIYFGASHHPVVFNEMKLAGEVGVNLIEVEPLLPWSGLSSGMFAQAVESNPNALFIPRIGIYPPFYWKKVNGADKIYVDENGKVVDVYDHASLASDDFIADVKKQLETTIRYYHNSPYKDRVIGYHLVYLSGGEWFYPEVGGHFFDYSKVNRLRFIKWLKERYSNINDLNKAWHKNFKNFDEIQIPPPEELNRGDDGVFRDPAQQRAVPDYFEYHNNLVADRIAELGACVKKLTSGRSLMLAFYGYENELVGNGGSRGVGHNGHMAMRRLLQSPNIDILCSPVSYFDRDPAGPCNVMTMVDSALLAGKMYIQEDDSRTYLWPRAEQGLFYPTEWSTLQCLRRNFGVYATHNEGMWWMDLSANGCLNSPVIWETNGMLRKINQDMVDQQTPYRPEIALLYDEQTYFYLKSDCNNLTGPNSYQQRSIFQSCGAPVGYYFVNDLKKIPDSVKLFVFVNTFRTTQEQDKLIEEIKKKGRTLLWFYAPGYLTETNISLQHMEKLTGFPLLKRGESIVPEAIVSAQENSSVKTLNGHRFGSPRPLAPTFYGDVARGGFETLASYAEGNQPAMLLKRNPEWTSIFCGVPSISVPMMRAVAREAGVTLRVNADRLETADAITQSGDYLFAYARERDGQRSFQVKGELVSNGSFERNGGSLPREGFGEWLTSGKVGNVSADVIGGVAHSGKQSLQSGPFNSKSDRNKSVAEIQLVVRPGQKYQFSAWAYTDQLDTRSADEDGFIGITIADRGGKAKVECAIAKGNKNLLPEKAWGKLEATYTHPADATVNEVTIRLAIRGIYQAKNLALDDVSFREEGTVPVDVVNVLSNEKVATGVTGWVSEFKKEEQKIFKMTPGSNY